MLSLFPERTRKLRLRAVACGLALATAFACSGTTTERGQLMLVLQTDMALPKDVSRIRIQVLQNGAVKFDHAYNVGGGPDDSRIPATLGIVGNNEGEVVEVRVIGFRGSEARTLNKVITTVPTNRVAMLRMPIQWLCDGQVDEFDENTFESTCDPIDGEEASCVAGSCQKAKIDSNDLRDYAPEEVFGGGTGANGGGTCFSTEECMADMGFDVEPDMTDCSVEMVSAKDENLNFAIKTGPTGQGICKGEDCYVPLDKNDDFGWKDESPDSDLKKVTLPPGVCKALMDGRATGLRASSMCATKTAEIPTCGPWSSVGKGPGMGGVTDGGVGPSQCPGFIPGMDIGALTGDPEIDDFLRAAAALKAQAEQLKNMAGVTCNNMLTTLGSPGTLSNPPLDQEVQDLCTSVGNVLAVDGVPYAVREGHCVSDTSAQLDCEAACGCDAGVTFEERCNAIAGTCDGACYGDCKTDGTPVDCNGTCEGTCTGTCDGECSAENADGCNGVCTGTCGGTCDGTCYGGDTCNGLCAGSGSCEGTLEAPVCTDPLEPSGCVEATCENLCAAQAGIDVTCSPSVASVDPTSAEENPQAADAIRSGMGPLTDVLARGEVLAVAAGYIAGAESIFAELDPTDPNLGCISAGLTALSEASASISAAMVGAATALSEIPAGSGLDAGTGTPDSGGGINYGCSSAGVNPLIDDFEDRDLTIPPNDGRSGDWLFIEDGSGVFDLNDVVQLVPARGSSFYGLQAAGSTFAEWGAGVALTLSSSCYDASNWDGIALWAKTPGASTLDVRVVTMDLIAQGCTPDQGESCAFQTTIDTSSTWQQYHLLWSDFSDFDGSPVASLNPANIYRIEVLQRTGSVDFTIDDVGFEGPPP